MPNTSPHNEMDVEDYQCERHRHGEEGALNGTCLRSCCRYTVRQHKRIDWLSEHNTAAAYLVYLEVLVFPAPLFPLAVDVPAWAPAHATDVTAIEAALSSAL